jgi:hypothetical protein
MSSVPARHGVRSSSNRDHVPAVSPPHHVSQTPLKDQNRFSHLAVLGLNLAALIIAVKTGNFLSSGVDELIKQWRDLLPAGVGVILAGVVNGLLSSDTKARLVFCRWANPLPGSFAFSCYAQRDSRIDLAALEKRVGPFPSEPREQNARWYKLYKSVSNEPAVIDAHRHFLLTRDYAGIAFLLLLTAGPLGIWQIPSTTTAATYMGLLLLQYLGARQAAQNYGVRFVTTVLALKASS